MPVCKRVYLSRLKGLRFDINRAVSFLEVYLKDVLNTVRGALTDCNNESHLEAIP